jgi:hypothetical protein
MKGDQLSALLGQDLLKGDQLSGLLKQDLMGKNEEVKQVSLYTRFWGVASLWVETAWNKMERKEQVKIIKLKLSAYVMPRRKIF